MGQIERSLKRHLAAKADRREPSLDTVPAPGLSENGLGEMGTQVTLNPRVLEKFRINTALNASATTSAYKMLRTRVAQRMRSNGWTNLAITSPRASAGKTVTAINTAISMARDPNQQVILVDCDLRKPSVHTYLGIDYANGLSDYLLNDALVDEILVRPNINRLSIITNRDSFENSSELLTSPKMVALTKLLGDKANSTIVIYDLPPLLDADDMLAFSPQVDAVLFVVAECETRRADLELSSELLKDINMLGVVLNKSSDEATHYY